jgi:epoxyqueuosine reductase QueG
MSATDKPGALADQRRPGPDRLPVRHRRLLLHTRRHPSRTGGVGKSGLLLTPSYGPRLKLCAIFTATPLEGEPVLDHDVCADCTICIRVCRSGALHQDAGETPQYDGFVCFSFYTANQGCGLCPAECPRQPGA